MSLLCQRATDVSVESTLRALSPALARLRLVRVTRSDSDAELNDPALQARVAAGAAKAKIEVIANSNATARAVVRGEVRRMWVMRSVSSAGDRLGVPVR